MSNTRPVRSLFWFMLNALLFPLVSYSQPIQQPNRLVFLAQPERVKSGQRIDPPIQVAVQNSLGMTIQTATDTITLDLRARPGTGVLLGVTTVQAVQGIAEFSDLRIVGEGGEFSLTAYQPMTLVGTWNGEIDSGESHHRTNITPAHIDDNEDRYGDVWGEGDFAYMGHAADLRGVDIIDIRDPKNPVLASHWKSESGNNRLQDVKVQNGTGYFASEANGGVYIVDVRDGFNPHLLSHLTAKNQGYNDVHNLFVDDDYLYLFSFRKAEVRVFNISDPSQPQFVRTIPSQFNAPIHDGTVIDGRLYTAGLDATGYTEIFDVRNVEEDVPYLGFFISGNSNHSNWPLGQGDYIAVAMETYGGDIKIWDIRDPETAAVTSIPKPAIHDMEVFAPHNPVVDGDWLYVSWYDAGLQVFNVGDPADPLLTGFFDTFPQPTQERFTGAWGVYPFLGQDRILVSDTHFGLFIFDHSQSHLAVGFSLPFEVIPASTVPPSLLNYK